MSQKLRFAERTDVGSERSENQDALGRADLGGVDAFFVCDGMGGHAGGSIAAQLAVATLESHLGDSADAEPFARIDEAIQAANLAIAERADEEPTLKGMGTTAVVLVVPDDEDVAYYAHVGDSRIYLVRGDEVRQLTRDHSFVQRLVDDGILDYETARNHPQSNVISRSLGATDAVEVDAPEEAIALEEGDLFVLCSDGLHGLVSPEEIATIAVDNDLDVAVDLLVDLANERGGHDNITVQLVQHGERSAETVEWIHTRPPPAPGTRLAKQAEEAAANAAIARANADSGEAETDAAERGADPSTDAAVDALGNARVEVDPGVDPTADTVVLRYDAPRSRNLGPVLVVGFLLIIVLAAVALVASVRAGAPERTGDGPRVPTVVNPNR